MATRKISATEICPKCAKEALDKKGCIVLSKLCNHCKRIYWRKVSRKWYMRDKRRRMVEAVVPLDGDTRSAYELVTEQLTKRKNLLKKQYHNTVRKIDAEIYRIKKLEVLA